MSCEEAVMSHGEQRRRIEELYDHANQLGLHGLMLLSPACPDCGLCHSFALVSDAKADSIGEVSGLLRRFADIAEHNEGEPFERQRRPPMGSA